MNDLKTEIEKEASRAAQLSFEAQSAFAVRNLAMGKALMKQAVDAGRNCQSLIQQYTQTCERQKSV
ncbi:MAG: hypothetical protein AB4426_20235 [Xenococcaceae cyanobacterium]